MDMRQLPDQLAASEKLDPGVAALERVADRVLPDARGRQMWRTGLLGHRLHPMLTDIPIGAWTSALLLDFFGGRRRRHTATAFVALGVAAAVPTALAGLADWTELDRPKKRVGVAHAVSNSTALLLYVLSLVARIRGRRGKGVFLGVLAVSVATVGGYLGGHLAYGPGGAATTAARGSVAGEEPVAIPVVSEPVTATLLAGGTRQWFVVRALISRDGRRFAPAVSRRF